MSKSISDLRGIDISSWQALCLARPNSGNIYSSFSWFAIGRWK